MTLSRLPLSYCTNVHPGQTVEEVIDGLTAYSAEVQRQLDFPVAAGLWLSAAVVRELTKVPISWSDSPRCCGSTTCAATH